MIFLILFIEYFFTANIKNEICKDFHFTMIFFFSFKANCCILSFSLNLNPSYQMFVFKFPLMPFQGFALWKGSAHRLNQGNYGCCNQSEQTQRNRSSCRWMKRTLILRWNLCTWFSKFQDNKRGLCQKNLWFRCSNLEFYYQCWCDWK